MEFVLIASLENLKGGTAVMKIMKFCADGHRSIILTEGCLLKGYECHAVDQSIESSYSEFDDGIQIETDVRPRIDQPLFP